MDKIELIDRAAVIADLKKQFAAVYKDSMTRPIMDDDPFVEVLAKSEGRHMQLFLEDLEEYLMSRPTLDVQPVRRGEWKYFHKQNRAVCTQCSFERDLDDDFGAAVSCPNCGADMGGVSHGTD